jgi:two-component system sensor histidine kinase DesK
VAVNQRIIRYAPYLWLVHLGVLGFQPALDPDTTAVTWVVTVATVVAFVPLYRAGLAERDQRRLTVLLGAMAGLAVVGTLVNAAAGVFIVYAAAFAGRLSPVRRAVTTVAVLAGLAGATFLISPTPMPWRLLAVVPVVVLVLAIGATGIVDGERARTQARLRRADEEIERLATIAERERIARDLHDLLGHTLSVIVLKAELASRVMPTDPDRAAQEMREVEQTARTALGEVRTAVAGYRAKGLGAELVNSQRALAAAGVDTDATVDLPVLPAEHEAALSLALREAVTNVLRHADARRTSIRARATVDDVELEVTDDGRGATGRNGAGLSGMRERITALGGQVDLQTGPAGSDRPGTRVLVRLPRATTDLAAPTAAAEP